MGEGIQERPKTRISMSPTASTRITTATNSPDNHATKYAAYVAPTKGHYKNINYVGYERPKTKRNNQQKKMAVTVKKHELFFFSALLLLLRAYIRRVQPKKKRTAINCGKTIRRKKILQQEQTCRTHLTVVSLSLRVLVHAEGVHPAAGLRSVTFAGNCARCGSCQAFGIVGGAAAPALQMMRSSGNNKKKEKRISDKTHNIKCHTIL